MTTREKIERKGYDIERSLSGWIVAKNYTNGNKAVGLTLTDILKSIQRYERTYKF